MQQAEQFQSAGHFDSDNIVAKKAVVVERYQALQVSESSTKLYFNVKIGVMNRCQG